MNDGNISDWLRSPGLFGKKPIIGFTMFVVGSLIFIALALNLVYNGPLIKWDLSVAESFHTFALNSSPLMTNIMVAGYYIGLQGFEIAGVLLALYFLYKRFWRELLMTAASGVGGLLFLFFSHIFMRPRPFLLFDKMVWSGSANIPGFPSGHTIGAITFCVLVAYLLSPKIKSRLGKFSLVLITSLIVIYVGVSRLYVGDHYLTDVIAGYALGVAWFGVANTSIEWIFQRFSKKEKNESHDNPAKNYN
jgi:undecaprenyl-diphosphatase